MATNYESTKDLCARFRCSSRTLFRRMKREINPFPDPSIQQHGSMNLWDTAHVSAWEQREHLRTSIARQGKAAREDEKHGDASSPSD